MTPHEGFEVLTAVSGEEALEKAAGEARDAILLDISIPGVDGWTVATRFGSPPGLAPPEGRAVTLVASPPAGGAGWGHLQGRFRGGV